MPGGDSFNLQASLPYASTLLSRAVLGVSEPWVKLSPTTDYPHTPEDVVGCEVATKRAQCSTGNRDLITRLHADFGILVTSKIGELNGCPLSRVGKYIPGGEFVPR